MIATFVKKDIGRKEWESYYSKIPGYQHIGKSNFGAGDNISMAFSMPTEDGQPPIGYYLLNPDELYNYDVYCKGNNHYPRPFEDVELPENTSTEKEIKSGSDQMSVIKDWLTKKKGMFQVKR